MAEVLITLGIIGVVAAMTLPSLVASYKERQTVVRLKQTYSLLDQALKMTIVEHGTLDQWSDESREFFRDELLKHLKVIKSCTSYNDYIRCAGFDSGLYEAHVLSNGSAIRIRDRIGYDPTPGNGKCHIPVSYALNTRGYDMCGAIEVDINGGKKPNKLGQDIFNFTLYTDGVIPTGATVHNSWIFKFDDACNPGKAGANDRTCTAWVVYHENMDYLKCRDKISWDGPYSCKDAKNNP